MPRPGLPPPRPSPAEERLASALFRALAPRLPRARPAPPPAELAPFEALRIPRPSRGGWLAGTLYPARTHARGGVLFLPPWLEWGQAYFHRRGRLQAVRDAGFHAWSVDFSGRGESSAPRGFFDRDVEDALAAMSAADPGLPTFLWGVSSGGYWAHPVLARRDGVRAAIFEDVSPHLIEWSNRHRPLLRPAFACFRMLFPRSARFLDLRRHAAYLRVPRVAYISGATDPGVRPEDTLDLARLAGGAAHIVPLAGHLEAIKTANAEILALALRLFEADLPQATAK